MAFITQFAEKVRQRELPIVYCEEKEINVLHDARKTPIVLSGGNLAEFITKTFVDREDDDDDEDSGWGDE